MKTYKEQTSTYSRIDKVTCDLCGVTNSGLDWGTGAFEKKEVTINYVFGNDYPEGDFSKIIETNVCPGCFKEKVVPALQAIGLKFWHGMTDDEKRNEFRLNH